MMQRVTNKLHISPTAEHVTALFSMLMCCNTQWLIKVSDETWFDQKPYRMASNTRGLMGICHPRLCTKKGKTNLRTNGAAFPSSRLRLYCAPHSGRGRGSWLILPSQFVIHAQKTERSSQPTKMELAVVVDVVSHFQSLSAKAEKNAKIHFGVNVRTFSDTNF